VRWTPFTFIVWMEKIFLE